MKRRKQETVTTYISTLTVNFGKSNNEPTKSPKSHSASHQTAPKQHQVDSFTTHFCRQAQEKHKPGTYYQLMNSTPPNRSKDYERYQEPHKNTSLHRSTAYFEGSSTARKSSESKSFCSDDGEEEKTSHCESASESGAESFASYSSVREFSCKEPEFQPQSVSEPEPCYRRDFKPTKAPMLASSYKTPDPPQIKSLSSSSSSLNKTTSGYNYNTSPNEGSNNPTNCARDCASLKTITTTTRTTTTTSEEKNTLSSVIKSEVNPAKPANDYGETDWYLDLLLRMQSLEMKQQKLHAQYDFLGKLANENREDLKPARDWARYDADNYGVEAY